MCLPSSGVDTTHVFLCVCGIFFNFFFLDFFSLQSEAKAESEAIIIIKSRA